MTRTTKRFVWAEAYLLLTFALCGSYCFLMRGLYVDLKPSLGHASEDLVAYSWWLMVLTVGLFVLAVTAFGNALYRYVALLRERREQPARWRVSHPGMPLVRQRQPGDPILVYRGPKAAGKPRGPGDSRMPAVPWARAGLRWQRWLSRSAWPAVSRLASSWGRPGTGQRRQRWFSLRGLPAAPWVLGLGLADVLLAMGSLLLIASASWTTAHLVGLTRLQVKLASPTVHAHWYTHGVARQPPGWSGSTGVLGVRDGQLLLITAAHCVDTGLTRAGLPDHGIPTTAAYLEMEVRFPSGTRRKVLRFGTRGDYTDVALLAVDAAGLVEGRDYVVLSATQDVRVATGEEVVAVGNDTATWGQVTEVWQDDGRPYTVETNANIVPGYSGGPLLLKRDDRYHWIGINTSRWRDKFGGRAVPVGRALKVEFQWHGLSRASVVEAIAARYRKPPPSEALVWPLGANPGAYSRSQDVTWGTWLLYLGLLPLAVVGGALISRATGPLPGFLRGMRVTISGPVIAKFIQEVKDGKW